MALLTRLAPFETWPQLEAASRHRYWDGFALATSSDPRNAGAVYLLGYVAEMLLKVAYFRLEGLPPYADTAPARGIARRQARLHRLARRSDHDLVYWTGLIEHRRLAGGLAPDPALIGALRSHAVTIAGNWVEALRYADLDATPEEVQEVIDGVEWIMRNQMRLWS